MAVTRIARSKDWTGELHQNCDVMEAAADRLIKATPGGTGAALKALADARKAFGATVLKLDVQRRPGFYAVAVR